MKKRIVIYTISIYALLLLQTTLLDYIKVYNIKPNILIVFIVSIALLRGNLEGAIVGFFVGLAQDAMTGKVLGFYSLVGLYLGLIIGSVNKRLYRENFLVIIFFTFIATIAYEWVVYVLLTFMDGNLDFFFPFRNIILPEAIYNSVISIFVYIFAIRLNKIFLESSKVSRKF